MDSRFKRLYEAAYAGDVCSLKKLLEEDNQLLDRVVTMTEVNDNPLHIAATLGHADFARVILWRKPKLALEFNSQHMSPLHLAAAQGHLEVAQELLQVDNLPANLCNLQNKDGYLPVHIAAIKGRLQLVTLLVGKCEDSVIAPTCFGETPLHLAVKAKHSEIVELFTACSDTQHVLNSKDGKGNTVLHLAFAGRQQKVIKLLLGQTNIDFNPVNSAGLTPLDVLFITNNEMGDLYFAEMLRAAGGKTAKELPASETNHIEYTYVDAHKTTQEIQFSTQDSDQNLIVVATLVATLTFAAALNPPGGAIQMSFADSDRKNRDWFTNWEHIDTVYPAGSPVYLWALQNFFVYNYLALLSSLFVILMCLPGLIPRSEFVTNAFTVPLLPLVMWSSMFFMVLAFRNALSILLYTDRKVIYYGDGLNRIFDMCIYFFAVVGLILWCKYFIFSINYILTPFYRNVSTEKWERSWMGKLFSPKVKKAITSTLAYLSMFPIATFVFFGIRKIINDMINGGL